MFAKLKNSLFNPGLSLSDINEDGEIDKAPQIVTSIDIGKNASKGVSKLRARNTQFLSSNDKKYAGKEVKRGDLPKVNDDDDSLKLNEDGSDPMLEKFFLLEEESDEEDAPKIVEKKTSKKAKNKIKKQINTVQKSQEESILPEDFEFDSGGDDDDDENEIDDNSFVEDIDDDDDTDENDIDSDGMEDTDDEDGDSDSGLYDDEENMFDVSQDDDDAQSVHDSDTEENDADNVKTLNVDKITDEELKSNAVKKQIELFDRLFETRIKAQECVRNGGHNLPQGESFQAFSNFGDADYSSTLQSVQNSINSLCNSLLELQETTLNSNNQTSSLLSDKTKNSSKEKKIDPMDEEITSSEDESDDESSQKKKTETLNQTENLNQKRKLDLDEIEEICTKRHRSLKIHWNHVMAVEEERMKLLKSSSLNKSGKGFSAFEENFAVMIRRLMGDKFKLLKRTQLRSRNRQNFSAPFGAQLINKKAEIDKALDIPKESATSEFERYDPEIYDDTDFHSRMLEMFFKSNLERKKSSMTAAQYYEICHKLRKQTKKTVDTRRSKGRKLKYDVRKASIGFCPAVAEYDDNLCDIGYAALAVHNVPSKSK